MDYKELVGRLKAISDIFKFHTGMDNYIEDAADAITDLLARAEAAEARAHELETTHRTEMCEDGFDCVELGKVRKELDAAEKRAEKAEKEVDHYKQFLQNWHEHEDEEHVDL